MLSESYDPRTWVNAATLAVAPGPSRGGGIGDMRRHAMPFALAASAAVLGVGAMSAWLTRAPAATPAPVEAAQIAAAPATSGGGGQTQRTLVLAALDDLPAALRTSGIAPGDAAAVASAVRGAGTGEWRATLFVSNAAATPVLDRLELLHPDGSGLSVTPAAPGRFSAAPISANLTARTIVRSGKMDASSFYSSAVAAGITDSLIPTFAKALAFDFDFQREVALGDAFEAVFTQNVNAQGDAVGAPVLLYASLTSKTKSASVYHYTGAAGSGEWFDRSGRSVVRSLLRTPVDGARVSSTFGMRVHPILGYQKMHEGIDFAVPIGTPIYASGNAVVIWSGMKGANGNLVVLRHDDGRETWYLHQSRIMPEVVVGARVVQGQKIGEVGTTGRSTGPHLHYGMKINGEWVDPSTAAVDEGKTLSGRDLAAFGKVRDAIDLKRSSPQG